MMSSDARGASPSPASRPSTAVGIVGLGLAFVGFSMSGVWVRWLVALDPFALTGWRVVVALLVLGPVTLGTATARRSARRFGARRDVHLTALRMTGFFVIAVIGFQQAPVALVLLCLGLSPAWVLLFERLAGRTATVGQIVGVGLALVGAGVGLAPTMLAWSEGGDAARAAGVGALCGLIAGILSASYAFVRPRLRDSDGAAPSAFLLAALTSFWGVASFAVAPLTGGGQMGPATEVEVGALLGFGFLSTAAPLYGFSAASRALPPVIVALTTPVIPIGGAFAAWVFLGQDPSPAFFIGAPVVLLGIVLVLTSTPS